MIAKTFFLPQFTYIASVLAPDTKTYDTTIKILLNFINTGATKVSGKGKWINQAILYGPQLESDLNFIDA